MLKRILALALACQIAYASSAWATEPFATFITNASDLGTPTGSELIGIVTAPTTTKSVTPTELKTFMTGTSGAKFGLLNGNLTFSGNNTFSGTNAFNSTVSGTGITSLFASPPAIGGTAPAAGAFTTLGATGNLTTNVTGSTQCLHANSSGVVSGTGSDCGSGGGGSGTVTVVGAGNLTSHGVVVGGGSQTEQTISVGTNGQLLIGQTGADPAFTTVSGDGVLSASGVFTARYLLTEVANASFPYQILATDRIVVPASDYATAGTVTLPASAGKASGDSVAINDGIYSKVTAVNTLTLAGNGSDTISGVSSMTAAGGSVTCTLDKTPSPPVWACRGSIQPGASATILVGQGASNPPNFVSTAGGDTTINNLGVMSTTKVANITYPTVWAQGSLLNGGAGNTVSATVTPTLGKAGTLGTLTFGNGTSGLFTLSPAPTGALGTSAITFPIGTTDFTATGGTSNFLKQASAGAAITVAQPAFTDLSGANSVAQLGGSGASHAALIDVGGTPTWKVVPDCQDSGGNHINYTQSTDAFSCGTTSSGGGSGVPATGNTTAVTVNANTSGDQILQELHPADASFNTANMELLLHQSGIYSTAATSTVSLKAKLCTQTGGGGTCITLATITSTATTTASNQQFFLDVTCGVKTTGASGNLLCHGLGSIDLVSGVLATSFSDANTAASSNFDLTGPNFIVFTVAFASASASNTMTAQNAFVSPLGMGGTVTSIATTGPITGGTITGTGTIACATCVTSAASLTSGSVMTGAGSQASQTNADLTFSAGALSLGVNTSEAGKVKLFGGTSGNTTLQAAAAAGTNTVLTFPGATFDFSASGGASQVVKQTSSGGAFSVAQLAFSDISGTAATTQLPATLLATGTSVSLTAPREYYICTGTCTVTPPVPAAGYEFCVMNDDNVATVITLAAIGSSSRYENTARTAYGTAGTGTFVSGGAAGDKVCLLGRDSTHYLTVSFNGTWTAN